MPSPPSGLYCPTSPISRNTAALLLEVTGCAAALLSEPVLCRRPWSDKSRSLLEVRCAHCPLKRCSSRVVAWLPSGCTRKPGPGLGQDIYTFHFILAQEQACPQGPVPFSHLGSFYSMGSCPGSVCSSFAGEARNFSGRAGVKLCMLWHQTRTVTEIQKVALNHCLVIHSGQLHLGK